MTKDDNKLTHFDFGVTHAVTCGWWSIGDVSTLDVDGVTCLKCLRIKSRLEKERADRLEKVIDERSYNEKLLNDAISKNKMLSEMLKAKDIELRASVEKTALLKKTRGSRISNKRQEVARSQEGIKNRSEELSLKLSDAEKKNLDLRGLLSESRSRESDLLRESVNIRRAMILHCSSMKLILEAQIRSRT